MQIDIEAGTLELDLDAKIEELIEDHAWDAVSCNTQALIEQELADSALADHLTDLLQDFLATSSNDRCALGDRFTKAVTMVIHEVGTEVNGGLFGSPEVSSPNPLSNANFEDAVRSMIRDELWRSAKLLQSRLEGKESDVSECK